MAQRALAQGAVRTEPGKPDKTMPPAEGITAAEIIVEVPQTARQEYPEVNAAIDRGLADVAAGRIHTRRSYAEYADIEIED